MQQKKKKIISEEKGLVWDDDNTNFTKKPKTIKGLTPSSVQILL